jgi:hypothetical protein
VQRRRDRRIAGAEELNLLRLAALEQLEVVDGQPGDRRAFPVGDDDAEVHEVDADADRLLRRRRTRGNQGQHCDGDGECVSHQTS